jgi:hypothetical protein
LQGLLKIPMNWTTGMKKRDRLEREVKQKEEGWRRNGNSEFALMKRSLLTVQTQKDRCIPGNLPSSFSHFKLCLN